MNRYGERAMEHWQRHLPRRYKALENPHQFFRDLGEEVETRIRTLEEAQQPSQTGADFLANLGRLTTARKNAENIAMSELALLPSEDDQES